MQRRSRLKSHENVTTALPFKCARGETFKIPTSSIFGGNKVMNSKRIILLGCLAACVFAASTATAQMRGHGGSMGGMGMRGGFTPHSMGGMPMRGGFTPHSMGGMAMRGGFRPQSMGRMPMRGAPVMNSPSRFQSFGSRNFNGVNRFGRFNRFN